MFVALDPFLAKLFFGVFAFIAVGAAGLLLACRNPLSGALNLIGVMLSLAGIYALLDNPFLAVLQVLVYAGAVMMLVVFVIMVLNQAKDHRVPRFDAFAAVSLALPLLIGFLLVKTVTRGALEGAAAPRAGAEIIAPRLFDLTAAGPGYYLLFELIGILLLVAVVAAVLLAKRTLDTPAETATAETDDSHGH